jgi:hypothetical protein
MAEVSLDQAFTEALFGEIRGRTLITWRAIRASRTGVANDLAPTLQ